MSGEVPCVIQLDLEWAWTVINYNPFAFGSGLINRVLETRFPGGHYVEKMPHQM